MADKQKPLEVFRKTTPGPTGQPDISDLDAGNIKSTGVGIREGELQALDLLGAELGEYLGADPVARNAIMRIAIRRFLEDYRAGRLTLADLAERFTTPAKPQPKLKL
jgi:hypothetical protein